MLTRKGKDHCDRHYAVGCALALQAGDDGDGHGHNPGREHDRGRGHDRNPDHVRAYALSKLLGAKGILSPAISWPARCVYTPVLANSAQIRTMRASIGNL